MDGTSHIESGAKTAAGPISAIPQPEQSDASPRTNWTGGRKQACFSCRKRKRKCDAGFPSCSACISNRSKCVYVPAKATPPSSDQQVQTFDLGDTGGSNNGWPSRSPNAPSLVEFSRPSDISFDTIYSSNISPASWNLGLEPRFFPSQDMFASSGYLNAPLEHMSNPQQWLVNTSMDVDEVESHKRPRNEVSSASSLYALQNSDSRYIPSESRATTSSHSGADGLTESEGRSKSVPTTAPTSPGSIDKDVLLPSLPHTLELLDIFFTRFHHFLPCIHQKTFTNRMKRARESGQPPTPLLWAIIAVAAPEHPDPYVRVLEESWMNRARTLFDENQVNMAFPTQSLQAAVLILFKSYTQASLTDAWLFLSQACRLATLLGIGCIDSSEPRPFRPTVTGPRDAIEVEEQRKTIWALYFFDRSLSCLAGLPLAIDDRHFQVNFPLHDDIFQAATSAEQLPQISSEPFTMDLSKIVSTSVLQSLNSEVSMNDIFRGSVLLGRIVNFHSQLHTSHGGGLSTELANLENVMSLFSFALSRERSERNDLTQKQLGLRCWLHVLVQTCNILLYHPMASPPSTIDMTQSMDPESSRAFQLCMDSMRRTVEVTKCGNRVSPKALGNPFLVTPYFLSCRFLTINWHEHRDQSDRDDIDFILMLMDRIGDRWPKLAKKFSKGIMADLSKTGEEARKMRIGTGSYLDVGCA